MSNTRSSSCVHAAWSRYDGLCQSIGCRVGASRLPSCVVIAAVRAHQQTGGHTPPAVRRRDERASVGELVQGLLIAIRMRTLSLGQRLEPIGDLVEAFLPRRLGHARVHVGVLVRLAGDGGLEVRSRRSDRQAGGGVAHLLEKLQMAMRVAGLAFGGGAE